MAISNCLFSPTSEIPSDFQFGVYLQVKWLTHVTTHRPLAYIKTKSIEWTEKL